MFPPPPFGGQLRLRKLKARHPRMPQRREDRVHKIQEKVCPGRTPQKETKEEIRRPVNLRREFAAALQLKHLPAFLFGQSHQTRLRPSHFTLNYY